MVCSLTHTQLVVHSQTSHNNVFRDLWWFASSKKSKLKFQAIVPVNLSFSQAFGLSETGNIVFGLIKIGCSKENIASATWFNIFLSELRSNRRSLTFSAEAAFQTQGNERKLQRRINLKHLPQTDGKAFISKARKMPDLEKPCPLNQERSSQISKTFVREITR